MELENNQQNIPAKRVVDVLPDHDGNATEAEPRKNGLTFDTLDLPTLDEVIDKTEPDYDDFEVLRGNMGLCDELAEFTRTFYYKEKLDPPVNGKDYRIKQLPKYPKFLALFPDKESINDITIFDVNSKFNPDEFSTALSDDTRRIKMSEAAGFIMEHMKEENRFSFDAPLVDSDIDILRKYVDDTEGISIYSDLLDESFKGMLPDFLQLANECESVDFNPRVSDFARPDTVEASVEPGDPSSFMPTPGGWTMDAN